LAESSLLCLARPRYKWEQNEPKIPSESALNKIIAARGWKCSVVFTLLEDTGAMPVELQSFAETLTLREKQSLSEAEKGTQAERSS
jgi:hypothetical protein